MYRCAHVTLYILATVVACAGPNDAAKTDSTTTTTRTDSALPAMAGDAGTVGATGAELKAVAANLVKAAMVKRGDRVLISGSVRDAQLMEDVAIESMKAGGDPVITLQSDQLLRRSYDEVPTSYDSLAPAATLALLNAFDVQISVDVGEAEGLLAGVPQARRTARAKAGEPVTALFMRRNIRSVNLGNGLYPTATLAKRLGVSQSELGPAFWQAARVPADTLRARGNALRDVIAKSRQLTLTHPNGTNLTFAVDASRGFTSDGAITPDKVKQGSAAASTWLPAGELILPARAGSAEGKFVLDYALWNGKDLRGLTLTFAKGRVTSMNATSGGEGLKEAYDMSSGAKDQLGYVDIGINPSTKAPVGKGRVIWSAPGSVVVGIGDNRGFGGTNASDFSLPAQLGGATLKADSTTIIAKGQLVK
jgi:leucyl aminopeptidase (aminopeptidase T)